MASQHSHSLSEWQLKCVLERANLIQYYDSFIKQGQCDVLQLNKETDKKFTEIMGKVGMLKKPKHVCQFKNSLHEWMKDQGKYKHLPSYVTKAVECSFYPAARNLTSFKVSERCIRTPYVLEKHTKEQKGYNECQSRSGNRTPTDFQQSENEEFQQQKTTKHTQSEVKAQKQHGLVPYYDDLLNKTVLDKVVLDSLISRCILMIEDREEIIKPTTQRERNRVLLDILTERPYCTLQVFKDVLQESNPHNTGVLELVSKMQLSESRDKPFSCQDIIIHEHIGKLQKNYLMFVNDVDCKTDILDHLYETEILDTEEKEEVDGLSNTRHESNRILLNKLVRKGEDAYKQLLVALRRGMYDDIVSDMEKIAVSELEIQWCQIGIKQLRNREKEKDVRVTHYKIEELTHDEHEEVIPKHVLEQFERRLNQWKVDDETFVSTAAEKQVMKQFLTKSSITIVGNSGTGKSFLSRHVALAMMKQGYIIIPSDRPGDIRKWFKHGRKTVFVFDDVCGRYTLNQQIYNDWKQRLDHITDLLENKCCKIIATCRLDVSKNEQFNSLSIFKTYEIDLSSEKFRLNTAEKLAFADVYFKDKTDEVAKLSEKYDFFPLLCGLYHKRNLKEHVHIEDFFRYPLDVFKKELMDLYRDGDAGKMKYCSLVLCVLFNNELHEDDLSVTNKEILAMIEDILDKCELNKSTSIERLRKSLERLEGTYMVKEDGTYKIIHDKLFDFLAKYFGEKMLQIFMDHANTEFINERFLWKTAENLGNDNEFTITIPDNKIKRYINRLLIDWENGFVLNVFGNRNMSSFEFTKMLINILNKYDQTKQKQLTCKHDNKSQDIALAACCIKGSVNMVQWLISKSSDINYCTNHNKSPLFYASQRGHANVVKELLKHGAGVNQCDKYGKSPLHVASQVGHVDIVKELLKHSPDVNKCNNKGLSPLTIASGLNKTEVVKVLLNCDEVDINICDKNGCSSLNWASFKGNLDVVKELLLHSPDVNRCGKGGFSPLTRAFFFNNMEVVKVLLQCEDVDINLCDNKGRSPLNLASQIGLIDVVKELLKYSPDVNKCCDFGMSPLFMASYFNKTEVVKILLQCDEMDVNLSDKNGRSPLYQASQNGYVDVVKELLQHSANVNKCLNDGTPPLQIACFNNKIDVVKVLLQCSDVEIDLCDNDGRSSLYWASQQGHIDIVKELLKHSANVNKCRIDGSSPLQIACYTMRTDVVKEVLKCDEVDIDHCDNDGCTSLYLASRQGHVNVVKELLQHLADTNIGDAKGKTPLCLAQEQGHVEVEALILEKR